MEEKDVKVVCNANDVDRLAEVKNAIKELQAEEKILKDKMLEDGRKEIPGNNAKVVISERTSEVFNEEAFLFDFKNSNRFEDAIKNTIIIKKEVIDQGALMKACKDEIIPIDYVAPFNEIKTSKVVSVK